MNANIRLGVDTGGTFTDLLVEGAGEQWRLYKRPTTPADPVRGLLDVIAVAAGDIGCTMGQLLGRAEMLVHGTTRATNAIVEGKTARTAFITTAGHRDMLLIREGGGRVAPMDYSQNYPRPYVPRALSFEIRERIYADGRVLLPLDRNAAIETLERVRSQAVEAIAVCLLWSVVNPAHELELAELLDRYLPGVPYTLSHRLNPSVREYRRASSTAIDASLKPLMGEYIGSLERRLRDAGFAGRLLLLTSAGGVMDAAAIAATPIHTIGSGPAAAPVAGKFYAMGHYGADLAIVTDAGGTTYDVSLVQHGKIPWTRETMVGHPKQGFMTGFASVDVRSVGAGGGSIGWVDEGGLLHVGPESAGSDPGPACWGRGGTRATVTDACVVLGYLDPTFYLGGAIEIDVNAAKDAILSTIAQPLKLALEEAAAAMFELACQNMVVAIEEITLARGIDPAAAILVGGGGGGGLYSAPIARRLGVQEVLIPPTGAALSAAGALLSELRSDYTTTHVMLTSHFDQRLANEILGALGRRCEQFVVEAAGMDVAVSYSVEARYPDQVWEITVPLRQGELRNADALTEFIEDFHRVHKELFAIEDRRSPVEIISWRAEVSCACGDATAARSVCYVRVARAGASSRQAFFTGFGWVTAQVRDLGSLSRGEVIDGPAFIESPVTTAVIPPGGSARLLADSSIALRPGNAEAKRTVATAGRSTPGMSGYAMALVNSQLESVVLAMRNTLLRTSRSAIMNMARDFACGILTAEADILTVCEGLPCMTLKGPDLQARYMSQVHPKLRAGDAFVHNSPYHGNTHAADWTVLMPVIDRNGKHRATVYAKAHMADCGNSIPTTFFAAARDVFEEGALIFPCVKIQRDYLLDDDFVRQCMLRIRVPEMWHGDFLAMLGAVRIGERRLLEFFDTVPQDTFEKFAEEWMNYSERLMDAAVRELPNGCTRASLLHDPVPGASEGVVVNVELEVDVTAARIRVDLRNNIDCQPFGMNLSESTVSSAVMAGVFSSMLRQVPLNSGSFRRIEILLRENCILGIPRHPYSCSVATTNLSELAGKAVTIAFAQLGDGFGLAEVGRHMPPAMAVISGSDPRPGRGAFQNFLCLLVCNGGGAPRADGWLTTIGIGVAGLQHHDSIEIDEMKYPIVINAQYLLPDTEGAGRHTGSPSAYVEYGPIDTSIEALFTSDGTVNAPVGVRGGQQGGHAKQFRRRSDGSLELLNLCCRVDLRPGESLISICTGAGGYGEPLEREPRRVAHDVLEELVSAQRARNVYGVVLDARGELDEPATSSLRQQMIAKAG